MQPINNLLISFHIIIMDFILALSITLNKFNLILTVTNKFSKQIILIFKKVIFTAVKWAKVLLNKLKLLN